MARSFFFLLFISLSYILFRLFIFTLGRLSLSLSLHHRPEERLIVELRSCVKWALTALLRFDRAKPSASPPLCVCVCQRNKCNALAKLMGREKRSPPPPPPFLSPPLIHTLWKLSSSPHVSHYGKKKKKKKKRPTAAPRLSFFLFWFCRGAAVLTNHRFLSFSSAANDDHSSPLQPRASRPLRHRRNSRRERRHGHHRRRGYGSNLFFSAGKEDRGL